MVWNTLSNTYAKNPRLQVSFVIYPSVKDKRAHHRFHEKRDDAHLVLSVLMAYSPRMLVNHKLHLYIDHAFFNGASQAQSRYHAATQLSNSNPNRIDGQPPRPHWLCRQLSCEKTHYRLFYPIVYFCFYGSNNWCFNWHNRRMWVIIEFVKFIIFIHNRE